MTMKETAKYPPLITVYVQDRRSNKASIPMLSATHPMPANAPAVAPHTIVVSGPLKKAARFTDMTSSKTNASPKIMGMLDIFLFHAAGLHPSPLKHERRKPESADQKCRNRSRDDGQIVDVHSAPLSIELTNRSDSEPSASKLNDQSNNSAPATRDRIVET